ncbi:GNAT family N-acetyltransferase [Aquirufa antheringensis]|jgi:ribosomal protein S18 acetylase RimI-like enzyme|uniref:GNAT family N-acetyltransferase n=1 Tax=Aquirufa antheringensis TaxID=2516559 RepID=A0A4V2IWA2_9BACT|nr:GNAT family N-acetyltransferase [Aquirufa antheringensis]MCE4217914.1 GNAT family N-acetyltransferase [Pseudarcicella sp. GAP-15]MCZ2485009.1 GNAT family N-acetyltransferase [Aquirufa antheringensis]MCZ2487212.1 GNAT family N-acetyltransferase [Aquirufa antheringensis]MCZ2489803.1 GNAT family N-acetyltransferase [Aquirufa antheringensis]TBH75315.1 GNAT family N-acetyltransferase [Aquirufa antheringensis]
MPITYIAQPKITAQDFIDILDKSTLGLRRPLQDLAAMQMMFDHGNVYVGAYDGDKLVGLARVMTDFVFTSYLSDLAIDEAYQHRGIGKQLIIEVKKFLPRAKIILLAAPAAEGYYPKIGMRNHGHCYVLDSVEEIK